MTTQRVEKTKVSVTEAPVNEYNDDEYEEMDISNGSEVISNVIFHSQILFNKLRQQRLNL